MTATEPASETALAVADTTGFVPRDNLYIQDTTVVADGEWARLASLTGTTVINLVDGLTTEKDNADIIWNDADIFVAQLDLTAVTRVRVVFQHQGAVGVNCHIKGLMITGDSIA